VSVASARPTAGGSQDTGGRGGAGAWLTPVNITIAVATLVALGLRAYQLATPGYLLGVTEYDDGSYFGSAVHLVTGILPYRDFVFVQPPGVTILMTPAALVAKVGGTPMGMAIARISTTVASAAGVLLAGLLVRHRGLAATILACGLTAIYPDAVATARTLLLEPWLVLFCLAGAVAVFDRDRVTNSRRRLVLGGLALGFGGAIEAWAIIPAAVILALCLPGLRRILTCLAGMAVGVLVPVLPFAALSPANFYRDLVVAQVGQRVDPWRVSVWSRLKEMFGLTNIQVGHFPEVLVTVIVLAFVVGAFACAWLVKRRAPRPLDWFALVTTLLIVGVFFYPNQFYFHFVAFLAPFLALAVALPVSRLVNETRPRADAARPKANKAGAGRRLRWAATTLAVLLIVGFGVSETIGLYHQGHSARAVRTAAFQANMIAVTKRVVPYGSCVLTDRVSYTIAANRFINHVPGCSPEDDGVGANLALSHGMSANAGAGNVPAVAAMWREAFEHAQYVLLTSHNDKRIAWSPALETYFYHNFYRVAKLRPHAALYARDGIRVSAARLSG
jgi:hypothetical protein